MRVEVNGKFRLGSVGMTRPFFILTLLASLLSGCGEDKAGAKAPPAKKSASVAAKFGTNSIYDVLQSVTLLKTNDHAGMQQVVRNNAAGYCSEG
ncbi:MAG: hypothetical protein QGG28_16815 [Alphaproteobacteria bacterium]|nr:hypothetical protein [Alphaproteobacteria bacterium]HJM91895.1 hypothetical protein [Alphaproteobacteria bacterium]